jgi:hypothetical protein
MAVLRFLASLFLLIAIVALVSDVTRAGGAGNAFEATSIAKHWAAVAPGSLQSAKAVVARTTHPLVWEALVAPVIATPAFVLFGAFALLCGVAGRRRERLDIFAN